VEAPVVVGVGVVAVLVLVRHAAARRVAAGRGGSVWLMFVPTLAGGFAILGAGIQLLPTATPAGIVMAIVGSTYLAILIGFLTRLSRAATAAGTEDDIAAALTEPLADFTSSVVGLLLIGALVALVGLTVWGASQAAH
jgi:hypothetical protein